MAEKESIWKKIRKGFAIFLSTLFVAAPASFAIKKDKETKKLEEGTTINDSLKIDETKLNEETLIDFEEETTSIEENFRESIKVTTPEENKIYSGLTYQDLLNKLNETMNKKGFDDIERKYIKVMFDGVYTNYDEWKDLIKDLPSKEEYIGINIIEALNNLNHLKFIEENSEEAKNIEKEEYSLAFTDGDFDVTIIYNKDDDEEAIRLIAERLLHELAHIKQKIILFDYKYFEEYDYLRDIITEGGATHQMKLMNPPKTEKMSSEYVGENGFTAEYENDNGEGYPKELNIYNNLESLVGFDVLQKVQQGKIPLSSIEQGITENYGQDIAKKILEELEEMKYNHDIEDEEAETKNVINVQKLFLKCMEQDISRLKTKKEVEDFTCIYRWYKISDMIKIYKNYETVTNEELNIEKLDKMMEDKILETKAFNTQSRDIAKLWLYAINYEVTQNPEDYYSIYVAPNLKTAKYEVVDGQLVLNYENRSVLGNREVVVSMFIGNEAEVVIQETGKRFNLQSVRQEDTEIEH